MAFTIGAVSAVSEKITNGNGYSQLNYENKYYTVEEKTFFKLNSNGDYSTGNEYISLKLKKSIKNTYKINSIKIRYTKDTFMEKETKYITLKPKDKSSILIKIPHNYNSYYWITGAQVNFVKNGKKGSIKLSEPNDDTWTDNTVFNGKTAKVVTSERGYSHDNLKGQGRFPIMTYNKIKITTKSSKYKIKSVIVKYIQMVSGDVTLHTFKGNGKTTMTINTPAKYRQLHLSSRGFKINYY
ncbi:MAG: hypothetical protein LBM96_02335 [Methanobrevibacter sp.]|nr:hypothetical protein [Candidatus Methanoflexus mossambicus]